jgi:phospholipase C
MGYYTRTTLGVLYALADEFTVCDHWAFIGSQLDVAEPQIFELGQA